MGDSTVQIIFNGAHQLPGIQRQALVTWTKNGMNEVVTKAGKSLLISTPPKSKVAPAIPGTLRLELTLEVEDVPNRRCGFVIGECGGGSIYVTQHAYSGVCGDDPATQNQLFLTTDEMLGHALANTAVHELGHRIADFEDNHVQGNFMSTGGPPRHERTVETRRAYSAGQMSWTPAQAKKLVENLRVGRLEFDEQFTVTSHPPGTDLDSLR